MTPVKTLTILVPIDFSPASAAGLRFALQWASQQKLMLVCVHVTSMLTPPGWSESRYRTYLGVEKKRYMKQLNTFVKRILGRVQGCKPEISCVLIDAMSTDMAIEKYCRRRKDIDFVCMGTNGAAGLKKLFGTHAGNLILHSNTPVIAVPASYRKRTITRILYASDLVNYDSEIERLIAFAIPLKAPIRALHLNYLGELFPNEETMQKILKQQFKYPLEISLIPADPNLSVKKNLQRHIAAFKASVVAVFSHQQHSTVERLLYPSVSEHLSFQLKTPLLVFPKTSHKHRSRDRILSKRAAS